MRKNVQISWLDLRWRARRDVNRDLLRDSQEIRKNQAVSHLGSSEKYLPLQIPDQDSARPVFMHVERQSHLLSRVRNTIPLEPSVQDGKQHANLFLLVLEGKDRASSGRADLKECATYRGVRSSGEGDGI